jgi:hypothetical protein
MINMINNNSEIKLTSGVNLKIEISSDPDWSEHRFDWFTMFLKYQAERNTFFEYFITEDENDRQ